jgi:hypothetical protein
MVSTFNPVSYGLPMVFVVNHRSGPKRVRYLFEPNGIMVLVPVLAHDIDIYYQWCERHRMVDEATGKLHNCMRGNKGEECEKDETETRNPIKYFVVS